MLVSACNKTSRTETGPPATSGPIRSENLVHVEVQRVEIPAGGSTEAVVRLSIDNGYHVNANPASYSYLIATELVVPPKDGVTAGSVSYPSALKKKFEFAEGELAVYEGHVELKTTLQAAASAPKGERPIAATLRVQACNDQVCYPPGTINLQIPISIR